MKIEILEKTQDYIICIKPAGLPVQTRSLISQDLSDILKEQLGGYIGIVHRLDQPVEGIMLVARNAEANAYYSRLFKEHDLDKRYLARIAVKPPKDQDTLIDYLYKNPKNNLSEVVTPETPGSKRAELFYRIREDLDSSGRTLEISLKTGRHHQIRVQLSHMGCPILGDRKYHPGDSCGKLHLCSYALSFHDQKSVKRSYEFQPGWI